MCRLRSWHTGPAFGFGLGAWDSGCRELLVSSRARDDKSVWPGWAYTSGKCCWVVRFKPVQEG